MIRIEGRLVTYGEIWFDEEPPGVSDVDVLIYRQRSTPVENRRTSIFWTLVNDLDVADSAIAAGFGGTNRYKIKRAESKDALESDFITTPEGHLDAFCDFYDAFARQKSLQPAYRRGLAAAAQAAQLVLTSARHDGEPIVWHAYIVHGERAAMLHSASHFRGKENVDRALLGRANRWLHWRDMLELKRLGIARYDWGGMFEDEDPVGNAGVNKFKSEFGGRRERTYNCTVPVSLKGRLYVSMRRTIDALPGSTA